MIFSSRKKRTACEAAFCFISVGICFILESRSMFALSVIFLLFLVPARAVKFYMAEKKDAIK